MRSGRAALPTAFGGAAAALLGLAWDVSNHTAYPSLFAHETPIDPFSPSHDLIVLGIVLAAIGGAWSLGVVLDRRLGLLALVPIVVSAGWLGFAAFAPPSLPQVTADQQAAADQLWSRTYEATRKYQSLAAARQDGDIASN